MSWDRQQGYKSAPGSYGPGNYTHGGCCCGAHRCAPNYDTESTYYGPHGAIGHSFSPEKLQYDSQDDQMQLYRPPGTSLASTYSHAPSTYSADTTFIIRGIQSGRAGALHRVGRAADASMLVGTTMAAFGPLDPSGITLVTGAATAALGATVKMAVYMCSKCKGIMKSKWKELKHKVKHSMKLCDCF